MAINLTTTSYLVLGLVARLGTATPYDLKRAVFHTVEYFWAFPHSQLYAEPERLERAGYLQETRERGGRRRRSFSLTDTGRAAFAAWLKEPTAEPVEIRDLGLLKLYFGELVSAAEVSTLARQQTDLHRERLAEYEALYETRQHTDTTLVFPLAVLDMGIRFESAALAFWQSLSEAPPQLDRRLQPQFDSPEPLAKSKKRIRNLQSKKSQEPLSVETPGRSTHDSSDSEPSTDIFFERAERAKPAVEPESPNSVQEDLPDHLL